MFKGNDIEEEITCVSVYTVSGSALPWEHTHIEQALWSQAREGTKVLTIICANSSYAILKVRPGR